MNTIKARFVGGPLHNQVLEVEERVLIQAAVRDWPQQEQHVYHRHRLLTFEHCTPFIEYWHESKMRSPEAKNRLVFMGGPLATEYCDMFDQDSITALIAKWGAEQIEEAAALSDEILHGDGTDPRIT